MRLFLAIAGVLAISSPVQAGAEQPVANWQTIQATAKQCGVKVIPQSIPKGLDTIPHGPAYRFDEHTTAERRNCFYQELNLGEAEQVLREMQFNKK